MQTAVSPGTTWAYDPTERLEAFQARQRHAYAVGRQALQERRIKVQLLQLYETLVRRVGANQYTWIGEARLAEELGVDVATIKRWMARLIEAGLIRRQRRFATTSLTFITAYDPPVLDDADEATMREPTMQAEVCPIDAMMQADNAPSVTDPQPEAEGSGATDAFFAPESAPTFGANLRRLNLKIEHLSSGGGESSPARAASADREITRILEREGVADFFLAPILSQKPLAELKAVSTYLNRQRNVEDRPKLFAWLVSRDFGAQLLSGRHQRQQRPQTNAPTDGQKYLAGELAYLIQGWSAAQAGAPPDPPSEPAPSASAPSGSPPTQPTKAGTDTWQQVLQAVRQAVPEHEYLTWFHDATLLDLTAERAVVGVPNIFARDHLTTYYQAQIAEALHASWGRAVPVQIEIGGEELMRGASPSHAPIPGGRQR